MIDDGGPYFPQTHESWCRTEGEPPVPEGASLRDEVAMRIFVVGIFDTMRNQTTEEIAYDAFYTADEFIKVKRRLEKSPVDRKEKCAIGDPS